MSRSGPITKDTSAIALGMAQIRVLASATNIASVEPVGSASDSIGALAATKYMGETEWFNFESGFPLIEDYAIVTREKASLECTFNELTPANLALAHGLDPTSGYTEVHSGEIEIGGRTAAAYVRMEALYTFPNGTNTMQIIFPRAQVTSSPEMDMQSEDAVGVPVTFESKNASSDTTGGDAVWDDKPLGRILFE